MLNRSGGWSGLLTVCAIWSEQRRHGRPPPAAAGLAEAAAPYGKTADVAAAELHAGDLLRLGRRRPGPRRLPGLRRPHTALVQISGGPRVHAMRAIEALGIPAMLGTGVTITSAGPRTGEPVTVTVAAGGLEAAWERATTVVFTGQPACLVHARFRPGHRAGRSCGGSVLRVHQLLHQPRQRHRLGARPSRGHRPGAGSGQRPAVRDADLRACPGRRRLRSAGAGCHDAGDTISAGRAAGPGRRAVPGRWCWGGVSLLLILSATVLPGGRWPGGGDDHRDPVTPDRDAGQDAAHL